MSERLKPCPFCGGEKLEKTYCNTMRGDFRRGIYCAKCGGGIFPYKETVEEAIKAWNTRAEKATPKNRITCVHCGGVFRRFDTYSMNAGEIKSYRVIDKYCSECGAKVEQ